MLRDPFAKRIEGTGERSARHDLYHSWRRYARRQALRAARHLAAQYCRLW